MKCVLKSSVSIAALAVFLSGSAYAADLRGSTKDAPEPFAEASAATNWAGPYIGLFGGWGYGGVDQAETNGGVDHEASYYGNGVFGGVTAGYNLQFRNIVFGFEAEGGYMNIEGDGRMASSNPSAHQDLQLEGGFYGVAAGRVGVALDRTLIYAKGGYAYFDGEATQDSKNPGFAPHTVEGTDAFSGFVYGGGIEQKLSGGVSVKVEYLHFDFDTETGSQTGAGGTGFKFTNETDLQMDTIKAGLNYRF